MIRLLLVRHGETSWNQQRKLQGQQDVALSVEGRQHAQALANWVLREKPGWVVTSALRRTVETADQLGVPICHSDARLNEAHLGQWEGKLSAQIRIESAHNYAAWRAGRFTPPEGESFTSLTQRVVAAVGDAVTIATKVAADSVLIVTHGGPIRAFLAATVGLDPARVVSVHPASLSVVDLHPGQDLTQPGSCRLRLYNYCPRATELEPPE